MSQSTEIEIVLPTDLLLMDPYAEKLIVVVVKLVGGGNMLKASNIKVS